MDGGMNGGMNGETGEGMNGGVDRDRLLKVKHVCVQILLRKEMDCPPNCLFDRNKQGGEKLSSPD